MLQTLIIANDSSQQPQNSLNLAIILPLLLHETTITLFYFFSTD